MPPSKKQFFKRFFSSSSCLSCCRGGGIVCIIDRRNTRKRERERERERERRVLLLRHFPYNKKERFFLGVTKNTSFLCMLFRVCIV